jgi:hypothetical protein
MQQALDALKTCRYRPNEFGGEYRDYDEDEVDEAIAALRDRLAHCDRCGKRLGGEGDIHTCTPDPIGDAQSALIAEMAAQKEQEPFSPEAISATQRAWQMGYEAAKAEMQPEQKPVSMRMPKAGDKVICLEDESLATVVSLTAGGSPDIVFSDGSRGTYLLREFAELFGYATPPAAAHMTEFEEAVAAVDNTLHYAIDHWQDRALKAEAKLAQPEQEPVEWLTGCPECGMDSGCDCDSGTCSPPAAQPESVQPVSMYEDWYDSNSCSHCGMVGGHVKTCRHYTTPPAAQRQPLTDEEMWRLWNAEGNDAMNQQEAITFARAIEAAHGIKENT